MTVFEFVTRRANTVLNWLILTGYAVVTLGLGVVAARGAGEFRRFVVAGRDRGGAAVFASLLATVIGASSTIGMINLGSRVGFAAWWWLGSGALGLGVCGAVLADSIQRCGAVTLADLMSRLVGRGVGRAVSLLVALAWVAVVAAQFIGAGKIVATALHIRFETALPAVAAVICGYCLLGGQLSVFRTDALQLGFILGALALTAGILWGQTDWSGRPAGLELVRDDFGPERVCYFLLVVGSGFVAGPDIVSRLLAARSPSAARKAALSAALVLVGVSTVIAFIGWWAHRHLQLQPGQDALTVILTGHLGRGAGMVVTLGLLSAILSSADTCLITASATLGHDLLGIRRTGGIRILTGLIGLAALGLAYCHGSIIDTLMLAYTVFNCGAVAPVVLAISLAGRRRLRGGLTVAAIACGGALGVPGKLMDSHGLIYAGMGVSAALAALAAIRGTRPDTVTSAG